MSPCLFPSRCGQFDEARCYTRNDSSLTSHLLQILRPLPLDTGLKLQRELTDPSPVKPCGFQEEVGVEFDATGDLKGCLRAVGVADLGVMVLAMLWV